jgi:hypothetical protein
MAYSYDRRIFDIPNHPMHSIPEGFESRILYVPIDRITSYQRFSGGSNVVDTDVEGLVAAIRSGKKLPVPILRVDLLAGQPQFTIKDGNHRIEALRRLKYKGKVPAEVWFDPDSPKLVDLVDSMVR